MLAVLCCVLAMTSIANADSKTNPDTLRVALLPDENANTIIKNNRALQDYLEQRLNKKVQLIVTTDYSSMIEAMRRGRIELAYFGPLSFVLAKSKADIEPFAALVKKGSKTYKSVLIANTESGINKIEDIKGKTVAFGDPASTSSHLIPKSIIAAHGLKIDNKDYKEVFLGAHDAVAVNVQSGNAQAGGLSYPILQALIKKGVIKEDKVKILTLSKPFPQYPWTMQSYLDAGLKEQIKKAFYELNKNDYADVLKPFKADGFAPIANEDYQPVRDLIDLLGLDPSKF
ncbi:MAG: phosphate ABC transporter substrate-binding protein [Phycisphaeraceae bacterium]|nr:phosphate ABC transporter substrate-binding protein [Phycisphaeraceae bacterium]